MSQLKGRPRVNLPYSSVLGLVTQSCLTLCNPMDCNSLTLLPSPPVTPSYSPRVRIPSHASLKKKKSETPL